MIEIKADNKEMTTEEALEIVLCAADNFVKISDGVRFDDVGGIIKQAASVLRQIGDPFEVLELSNQKASELIAATAKCAALEAENKRLKKQCERLLKAMKND